MWTDQASCHVIVSIKGSWNLPKVSEHIILKREGCHICWKAGFQKGWFPSSMFLIHKPCDFGWGNMGWLIYESVILIVDNICVPLASLGKATPRARLSIIFSRIKTHAGILLGQPSFSLLLCQRQHGMSLICSPTWKESFFIRLTFLGVPLQFLSTYSHKLPFS